jgi:hypothetical protein
MNDALANKRLILADNDATGPVRHDAQPTPNR